MLKINSDEEIKNIISGNEMVIIYFSNKVCGACEVIKSKVERILESYSKVKSVNIDGEKQTEFAAMNNVFSFPLLILYINGKETIRVGRNVDLLELEKSINRYYNMLF
ncbi:thioredoxin family protein [Clostridium estertheticum]|uniref:Thiol reductase thioredoxin n=1 Tax=Clostridium estertheticum subsp. estertheticum TaxID=1552 RepID=A0A1J0GKH0_9CLOT|nr:thioredoxin family protein [Clostridium estertheticum]APC41382.1 thiol reductase thioredoxin [Clostridium estertheticum subsp. estertheticum]MBZ9616728.1 thioredoxin family protein [Clostridium estertheticum subsp. laramiense]WAG72440.1 thioredoxin family protein [Clostridium estertheticum]